MFNFIFNHINSLFFVRSEKKKTSVENALNESQSQLELCKKCARKNTIGFRSTAFNA